MLGMVTELVRVTTNVSDADSLYTIEAGLELWHATLINSNQTTDELLGLFPNAYTAAMSDSDNIKLCLRIVESYILLVHQQHLEAAFVPRFGANLIEFLLAVFGEVCHIRSCITFFKYRRFPPLKFY